MSSTPRLVRVANHATGSESPLNNLSILTRLSVMLVLVATAVCGAWNLASAQENSSNTTRYMLTPPERLLAVRSDLLPVNTAVKAQNSGTTASGPWIYTVAGDQVAGYSGDGGPATAAALSYPFSAIADSKGNLYIADTLNNVVRKVAAGTGIITTFAGTGKAGYKGDNGPAASAELSFPTGLALDSAGNLYIADTQNNVVREVSATTGVITSIAGNGNNTFSGDNGLATRAGLNMPQGLAFDGAGNLYIADYYNFRIRKITANTGIITTVAGNGTSNYSGDGAQAVSAGIAWVAGIAVNAAGDIYLSDSTHSVVRKVTANSGLISTIAGDGTSGFAGNGGPATAAEFRENSGLALDSAGNLLIADLGNNMVRAISATTGKINTIVGWGGCSPATSDGGSAACSNLIQPQAVSVDSSGNLYIATTQNVVREVPASTVAATATTAEPTFNAPAGTYSGTQTAVINSATPGAAIYVSFDGSTPTTFSHMYNGPIQITGSVTIKAIALAPGYLVSSPVTATYTITTPPTAVISTVAGNGGNGFNGINGPATNAQLRIGLSTSYLSEGIVLDSANNLYFSDPGNNVVWKVLAKTGIITIFAGDGTPGYSGDGGLATNAQLSAPNGLAIDAAGDIFISDAVSNVVRKVTASTGVISTVAGNGPNGQPTSGSQKYGDGGPATSAVLNQPTGLVVDESGNLYIGDTNHSAVRMVSAATGNISTVAGGKDQGVLGDGGPATSAVVLTPRSLALDSAGNLYISERYGAAVRKVTAATGIITTVAGSGTSSINSGDGGLATLAGLEAAGIILDKAGNLYISGSPNEIRKVSANTGIISRVAGNNYIGYSGDGGSAAVAELNNPTGLAIDASGSLYFADANNEVIRKITFPPPAPTPTFSVAPGIFQTAQTVYLSDSLQGATIYFTTDGSTPTTDSEVYTSPIVISATTTLQAVAVVKDYSESSVATGLYTIQVKPTITWAPPAAISYGASLSDVLNATALNGSTKIAGSFAYTATPSGGVPVVITASSNPTVGSYLLTATFTPTTIDFTTATASVQLTVGLATPPLALTSSANPAYVSNPVTFTATLTSPAGAPTGTADFYDGTTKLGTGTLTAGVATYATSTLAAGAHSITAVYSGDGNFKTVTSAVLTETIEDFTFAPPANGSSSATAVAGGQATYQLAFGAVGGTTGAQAITLSVSGLPVGSTATFSPASIPANSPATNVTLTISLPARSAALPVHHLPFDRSTLPVALGLLLLPFAGRLRRAGGRWSKLACMLLLTLGAATMVAGVSGCGGGGSSSGSGSGSKPTVPQTYTLTVSATSGLNVHTTTLTLTVN